MFRSFRTAATTALILATLPASADVLTFNDLSGLAFFTSDYQGFRFGTNSASTNAFFYSNDQSVYPAFGGVGSYVAVDPALYNNSNFFQGTTSATLAGPLQLITSATPFQFQSAFLAGSGRPETIGYKLYAGSTLVFTSTPVAVNLNYTEVSSGYAGFITGVEIFGHQGYYALDNFTYSRSVVSAVPEPATFTLVFAGLAAAGGAAVRRRRLVRGNTSA